MDASNFKEIRNSSRSTGFRDETSSDTGETLMLAIMTKDEGTVKNKEMLAFMLIIWIHIHNTNDLHRERSEVEVVC
jgi:hypothetical protein